MIKLKDLLLQELKKTSHVTTAAHETTAIKNVWSGRLPIYPKLMKKILGDVKINSFHTTNFEGLKNVKSTVGTKKSLSTFTALSKDSMMAGGMGVQTKGGFVLQLEGNLLISSTADIGSVPDESGRRWIHANTLEDYFGISGWDDEGIFDKINVLLDIRSALYFQPPTTSNNSKRINILTVNPVGKWVDFLPINQDCFCSATLSIITTNKNKTATAPT